MWCKGLGIVLKREEDKEYVSDCGLKNWVNFLNFGGSDGKASSRNAGDQGTISRSGRSPGEGNGNPLQYSCLENHGWRSLVGYSPWGRKELDMTEWFHFYFHFLWLSLTFFSKHTVVWTSLVAQQGKNHLQCGRLRFDPWVWEDPLEECMATHSSILAWRIPMDIGSPNAQGKKNHMDRSMLCRRGLVNLISQEQSWLL